MDKKRRNNNNNKLIPISKTLILLFRKRNNIILFKMTNQMIVMMKVKFKKLIYQISIIGMQMLDNLIKLMIQVQMKAIIIVKIIWVTCQVLTSNLIHY